MTDTDYMTDHRGARVPVSKIKPQKIEENALVHDIVRRASELSGELSVFKQDALANVAAFRELVAEQYNATLGGKKGNMTLSSFDGTLQVQVAISESITFGPELEAAKALIDSCVRRWSEGTNDNIKVLIEHAFQVNKAGKIDTARVLGLRQLEFDDPEWNQAMDAVTDAIRITGSKTYLRIYERDPETEVTKPISLDLAKL